MIAATLTIRCDTNGRPYLSGTLNHVLERGAIVMLRKQSETEYSLLALSGDKRQINTSRENLSSFVLFDTAIEKMPAAGLSTTDDRDIPQLPADPIADEFHEMQHEGRA